MRKRGTQPKKTKSSDKPDKLTGLGPQECHVCKTDRPGGHLVPLPHQWMVHTVDDDRYVKGYWMPLTCSDKCRTEGGFKIWR